MSIEKDCEEMDGLLFIRKRDGKVFRLASKNIYTKFVNYKAVTLIPIDEGSRVHWKSCEKFLKEYTIKPIV